MVEGLKDYEKKEERIGKKKRSVERTITVREGLLEGERSCWIFVGVGVKEDCSRIRLKIDTLNLVKGGRFVGTNEGCFMG